MKKCQYFADKKCNIFWHFWAKNLKGQKLEIFHVETLYPALKKPGKQKNLRAALHCEFLIWNTQIFSKYFHNFDQQKYLDSLFKEMFNWSPQLYLHPVCCMFELQLILWQFLLLQQLVPKCKKKLKLGRRSHSNIFIWNISDLRKWEPRSSFWQNLILTSYLGALS